MEALTWALSNGRVVDVDVQFTTDDKSYDSLEESLSTASKDAKPGSAVIICSFLVRTSSAFSRSYILRSERVATSGRFVLASRQTSHSSDVQGISSPRRVVIAYSQHLYKIPPAKLA